MLELRESDDDLPGTQEVSIDDGEAEDTLALMEGTGTGSDDETLGDFDMEDDLSDDDLDF